MKWVKASERLPELKGNENIIFAAREFADRESGDINGYTEMCLLDNNKIRFEYFEIERNKPILELFDWLDENENKSINLIDKYNKKLKILKDNRALSVDTNTDAENELYDKMIHQIVEFIQDIKQED